MQQEPPLVGPLYLESRGSPLGSLVMFIVPRRRYTSSLPLKLVHLYGIPKEENGVQPSHLETGNMENGEIVRSVHSRDTHVGNYGSSSTD